jgi:hypothetical protein
MMASVIDRSETLAVTSSVTGTDLAGLDVVSCARNQGIHQTQGKEGAICAQLLAATNDNGFTGPRRLLVSKVLCRNFKSAPIVI